MDTQKRRFAGLIGRTMRRLGIRYFSYEDAAVAIKNRGLSELSDMTEQYKGLALYNGDIPVILFDGTLQPAEKRYTIAHELGHLVLGHLDKQRFEGDPERKELEADIFAAAYTAVWYALLEAKEEVTENDEL